MPLTSFYMFFMYVPSHKEHIQDLLASEAIEKTDIGFEVMIDFVAKVVSSS